MNLTLEDFTREPKYGAGRQASDHPITSVTPHGHPFGIRGREVYDTVDALVAYLGGNYYQVRRPGPVLWSLTEGLPGVYYICHRTKSDGNAFPELHGNFEYILNWSVKFTHNERNDRFCVTIDNYVDKTKHMSSLCMGKLLMKTKKYLEASAEKIEKSVEKIKKSV